jgi:hypothetical protein
MNHPDASGGIAALERLYDETLRICDDLEAIADTLPNPDRRFCRRLAIELDETIEVVGQCEERSLFPILAKQAGMITVTRLRQEHAQDRSVAAEIVRALVGISHGGLRRHYDAIGYMLRAYFLAVRRHIAFEQALLASVKATSEPR